MLEFCGPKKTITAPGVVNMSTRFGPFTHTEGQCFAFEQK